MTNSLHLLPESSVVSLRPRSGFFPFHFIDIFVCLLVFLLYTFIAACQRTNVCVCGVGVGVGEWGGGWVGVVGSVGVRVCGCLCRINAVFCLWLNIRIFLVILASFVVNSWCTCLLLLFSAQTPFSPPSPNGSFSFVICHYNTRMREKVHWLEY